MPTSGLNSVIEDFNRLSLDEKEYLLEIIQKQLVESKRDQIAKRAQEARENLGMGRIHRGSFKDLFEDLEND
jgi:hypothetical protein